MADARVAAAAVALVALAATGCSDDGTQPRTSTGSAGTGSGGTGSGGSVAFELVATDRLTVSPDGQEVLADCWNGICRWDTASGALGLVPDRGSVAVSPDWSTVATVDDADVVLEDLDSGEPVVELTGLADDEVADGSAVTAVAYSPDGGLVAATGTGDDGAGRLVVWTVAGAEEASFDTAGQVHRIAFSPDGERLATAGNGPVEVHDLATGDSQQIPSGDGGAVAWSADGALLVGPGSDDHPVVWDTDGWGLVAELRGTRLHEAAFAPTGRTLALTSLDQPTVTLWDPARDARRARALEGHADPPGAVAWSPDGSVVYAVSAEDGVRAWDAAGTPADVTFELPEGS